jgi:hypothetical protein
MYFTIRGWTWNSRKAPEKIVTANASMDRGSGTAAATRPGTHSPGGLHPLAAA